MKKRKRKAIAPITENFRVVPAGLIKDGSASVTIDSDAGVLTYSASVKGGIWPVYKNLAYNGTYKVAPADLKSTFLNSVGKQLVFESVTLTVETISPGSCVVGIVVAGQSISGTAVIDTSADIIQLRSAQVAASVSGLSLNINVQKI